MRLESRLDNIHHGIKSNKWYRYFAIFSRIALAAGFIPSGFTKVFDERFTSLSIKHPMGNYLEALYHTGFYYHFIGYVQVAAALLLLIPYTATLGAVIYFPLILNICVLSLAVGFDGSLVTSPLMVLANLYLLCWDYDRLKFILPFTKSLASNKMKQEKQTTKFPLNFFLGAFVTVVMTVLIITNSYTKKTRNTLQDCRNDCMQSDNTQECFNFCDCIHIKGKSFNECAEELSNQKHKNDK